MKTKLLKLLQLVLLGGVLAVPAVSDVITPVHAEDSNVIVASSFAKQGESDGGNGSKISYKYGVITISSNGGYTSDNGVLRVYDDKNITISSSTFAISKLDFELDSSYTGGLESSYTLSTPTNSWSETMSGQARFKTITVTLSTDDVVLSSISVDTSNATTSFTQGSNLDLTGVKVNGTKVGGGTVDVTSKCSFSPDSGTKLDTIGLAPITVTYSKENSPATESGEDLTTTYNVVVSQSAQKAVYTKVTSASDLSINDKVIIVDTANKKAASAALMSEKNADKHYLDKISVTLTGNEVSFEPDTGVGVFTIGLGKTTGTYSFANADGKFLAPYSVSAAGLKYESTLSKASSWTLDLGASSNRMKSNIDGATFDSTVYLKANNDFRMYKSSSLVPEIDIYKYSSGNERVVLDDNAKEVYEDYTTTISATPVEFTATSFAWETSDSGIVSIVSGGDASTVTIKGEAEGSANLTVTANDLYSATCVVTVKAAGTLVIEPGDYFITDLANKYLMGNDLSTIEEIDYSDPTHTFTFEFAGKGDGSYWISSGGKYLTFRQNVIPDGKRVSEMVLWDEKVDYWTVTEHEGSYRVSTSYGDKTKSIAQDRDNDWLAFNDVNYVNLTKQTNFDHFEIGHAPQYKEYYVGETFKTTGLVVNAVFENGAKADVTSRITWDKIAAGTEATGKVTIGGSERLVSVPDLVIYAPVQGAFTVTGLQDKYYSGEKFSNSITEVKLTFKVNETTKDRVLTKEQYKIEPDILTKETTSVRMSLVDDPTIYKDFPVTIMANKMVATGGIKAGDIISIGTLNYTPYELKGGVELTYTTDDGRFHPTSHGYLPFGNTKFEVAKQGSYYTFQEVNSGAYLQGSTSAFMLYDGTNQHNSTKDGDGKYNITLPVTLGGTEELLTIHTQPNPTFEVTNEFDCSIGLTNDWSRYVAVESDLFNNKLTFQLYVNYEPSGDPVVVNFAYWRIENGSFVYSFQGDVSTLPDECLFTATYTVDIDGFEYWELSSKAHPENECYYNRQGDKIGFYQIGSSYDKIMLFRDDSVSAGVQSVSVSFYEGMNEIGKDEQFPWTSSLVVMANYGGGVIKQVPIGGYEVTLPDTSVIGPSKGTVTVDGKSAEYTVTVKGHTQAFDVVCKDPILVGETYQATLDNHYVPPVDEPIQWSVSDPTLASIDQDGNVTGLNPGYVDVIATSYDGTYSNFEHIRIYKQVESVTLDKHEVEVNAGATVTLNATVLPEDASNKKVLYSSSDASIAYVDEETGEITGVSEGTATITCAAQNHPEENYDTCVVTVKPAPVVHVTGISLNLTNAEVEKGKTITLSVNYEPSNATVQKVTWSTNHDNIATVDQNGKVKGVAKGECVITATSADGGFTASCTIKVKGEVAPIEPTNVTLNKTSLTLDVNDSPVKLVATVTPVDATTSLYWDTDNDSIATVSSNGTVTPVGVGECAITVSTDNGKRATCNVTVKDASEVINVNGVTLSKEEAELKVGKTLTLSATVSPTDASDKSLTWTSSDKTIATVSSSGKVTAKAEGTATITVTTKDGNFTATCVITVVSGETPDPTPDPTPEADTTKAIVILGSIGGGAAVGIGLGIGIPVSIHKKHKKLIK